MLKFVKLFTLTLLVLGSIGKVQAQDQLDCKNKVDGYNYYIATVKLKSKKSASNNNLYTVLYDKNKCNKTAGFTCHVKFSKSGTGVTAKGKLYFDGMYNSDLEERSYASETEFKKVLGQKLISIMKKGENTQVTSTKTGKGTKKNVDVTEKTIKTDFNKLKEATVETNPDSYEYKDGAKLLGDRKLGRLATDMNRKSKAIYKKENQINDIVSDDKDLQVMTVGEKGSEKKLFSMVDGKYVFNNEVNMDELTEDEKKMIPSKLQNKISAVNRKEAKVDSREKSFQSDFITKSEEKIEKKNEVSVQLESDMASNIENGETDELGKALTQYRQNFVEKEILDCEKKNMKQRQKPKADGKIYNCQEYANVRLREEEEAEDSKLFENSAAHAKMSAKDERDTSVDINEDSHLFEVAAKIVDEEKINFKDDCTGKVVKNLEIIAESNSVDSVFGEKSDYKLRSPAQCRDARDDGIFAENEDLYSAESLNKNFYKLLKGKGKKMFCRNMAKAKNKKLGYSCQNFLDARKRCSTSEFDLIDNNDISLALGDIMLEGDTGVTSSLNEEQKGRRAEGKKLITISLEKMPPYVTDEFGGKQFTFFNEDVCEDVLLDEFIGCMGGDASSYREGSQRLLSNLLIHPGKDDVVAKTTILDTKVVEIDLGVFLEVMGDDSSVSYTYEPTGATGDNDQPLESAYSYIKHEAPSVSIGDQIRVEYACDSNKTSFCPSEKTIKQRAGVAFYDQFGTCLTTRKVVFDNYNRDEVELVEGNFKKSEQKSFDGKFTCKQPKEWTLDYGSCLGLINAYGAVALGTKGVDLFNRGSSQIRNSKKAKERSERVVPEGEDPLISGIMAQRDTYSIKQQEENVRMTANAVAAAGLTTKMTMFYNSPKKNARRCENLDEGDEKYMKYYCHIAHYWSASGAIRDDEFFPNQEVRAQMWQVVSQLTVESALAGMRAADAKNRKNKLDKYKAKFAALEDNSEARQNFIDLDYCKFNPASPQCRGRGANGPASNGFTNGGISMQSGGQNFNIKDNDDSFGEYDDNTVAGTKNSAVEDLGNLMDNESVSHLSNDFNAPGAGKVGKAGPGGGAGGGGGSLGGSGGGGGAGPSGAKSAGGKQKYKVTTKKGRYKSGGSAKFTKAGSIRKKKASRNAFSKLLGNGRSRKVASDDKTILPSHSGLFDKISKRYNRLSVDNRIHNLEKIKK